MARAIIQVQLVILASIAASAAGFATLPGRQDAALVRTRGTTTSPARKAFFFAAQSDDDDEQKADKLSALGFTETEISRSSRPSDIPREDIKVRVDVVDDVDPVTITALGFGLIALNFLLFANLGDGGISGLVARLINTFG